MLEINRSPLSGQKHSLALPDIEPARVQHSQAPSVDQTQAATIVHNASRLFKDGELEMAEMLLLQVLQSTSTYIPAVHLMAQIQMELNRPQLAEKIIKAALNIGATLAMRMILARSLYVQCKDDEARDQYLRLLFETGENPELSFEIFKNLGSIHVRSGDFDEAEDCFNKALSLNSNSEVLLVNFGVLEIQRGHFDKAWDKFTQALSVDAQCARAWVGLALVHRAKGDFELAWGAVLRALDFDCDQAQALGLVMDWSFKDGKYQEGIRVLQAANQNVSDGFELGLCLAKLLERVGNIRLSYYEALRAVETNPMSEEAILYHTHIRKKYEAIR